MQLLSIDVNVNLSLWLVAHHTLTRANDCLLKRRPELEAALKNCTAEVDLLSSDAKV